MQRSAVPVDRLEIGLWRRHLHIVVGGDIEGPIAADAKVDPRRPDQRFDLGFDQAWRRRRSLNGDIVGQALTLRRVEDREMLQKWNSGRLFAGLACAALFVVGHKAVSIDDGRAVLALPHVSAEGERLAKGQPMLGRKAVLDHGAPKDQDVDAGILTGGRRIPRHGERRLRRSCTPGLDPGKPAILEFGDDLVGDVVIEIGAVTGTTRGAIHSGHRDKLHDGRREPLSQPSTRHGRSVRTLALGALRGVPAEGVGRDRGSAAGEGFPRSIDPSWRPEPRRTVGLSLKALRPLKSVRNSHIFLTGE